MSSQRIVNGFSFTDQKTYEKAKSEAENIALLRSGTDLTDPREAVKTYLRLVDNNSFETPVGYSFLKELRDSVVASGLILSENLNPITIHEPEEELPSAKEYAQKASSIPVELPYNIKKYRIVILALVAVVIALFAITIYTKSYDTTSYEAKIQNKYSSWEEELTNREREIAKKEAELFG